MSFSSREDDAIDGHDAADDDERLPAGEPAEEDVDGGFGGIGGKDDAAGDGGLGVGVGEPGGQRRGGGVD